MQALNSKTDEFTQSSAKKDSRLKEVSHLSKWIGLLFTKRFIIEFLILIIHPLPFVEANYPI